MSRFGWDDVDYDGPPPAFWMRSVDNAIRGKRGQKILLELREALLALPEKRLIKGAVVHAGEVCALGALAAHRLRSGPLDVPHWIPGDTQVASLEELEAKLGDYLTNDWDTLEFGCAMGLTRALAWAISYQNDEGCWETETPEQIYRRVLGWVDEKLIAA